LESNVALNTLSVTSCTTLPISLFLIRLYPHYKPLPITSPFVSLHIDSTISLHDRYIPYHSHQIGTWAARLISIVPN
jgi:hypothetical protein